MRLFVKNSHYRQYEPKNNKTAQDNADINGDDVYYHNEADDKCEDGSYEFQHVSPHILLIPAVPLPLQYGHGSRYLNVLFNL